MLNIIKYHPDYTAIDNAFNLKMPECIVLLITTYTITPNTHLFSQIKKKYIPYEYVHTHFIHNIHLKINAINLTNTTQHKNLLRYQLFNYIIDYKPFILNKGLIIDKVLKHNLNYLYYHHNLFNLTYHHKLLFGTELQ